MLGFLWTLPSNNKSNDAFSTGSVNSFFNAGLVIASGITAPSNVLGWPISCLIFLLSSNKFLAISSTAFFLSFASNTFSLFSLENGLKFFSFSSISN